MFGLNNSTRSYSHPMSSKLNSTSCTRCGYVHVYGQCRALKATCNRCFLVGHYARLCYTKKQNASIKSETKKQRDIERMTNFVRKKTFQSNLPFYNVEDEYLKYNQVNSTISSTVYVADILKSEMTTLKTKNTLLTQDYENLKIENNKLKQKLKQTSDSLNLKCADIQQMNNLIQQSNELAGLYIILQERYAKAMDNLKFKSSETEQLEHTISNLEQRLQQTVDALNIKNTEIEQLNITISEMKKDSDRLVRSKTALQERNDQLKESDNIHRKALLELSSYLGSRLHSRELNDLFDDNFPDIVGLGPRCRHVRWNGRLDYIYNDALCVEHQGEPCMELELAVSRPQRKTRGKYARRGKYY